MTDTVTDHLRKAYIADFNARFEREYVRAIERAINEAALTTEFLTCSATVNLQDYLNAALRHCGIIDTMKDAYIDKRMRAAAIFIENGANNGT